MNKKYYLKDLDFFNNISHFKDLRSFLKKDENGFFFRTEEEYFLIKDTSVVIECYYKPLATTFSNPHEVCKQFKKDYGEKFEKESKILKDIAKNITDEKELNKYGFTEGKLAEIKYYFYYVKLVVNYYKKMIELENKNVDLENKF